GGGLPLPTGTMPRAQQGHRCAEQEAGGEAATTQRGASRVLWWLRWLRTAPDGVGPPRGCVLGLESEWLTLRARRRPGFMRGQWRQDRPPKATVAVERGGVGI